MKRWTKDEEELLKAFVEMGWTHKEIGCELDRSFLAIKQKTCRLEIKSPNKYILKTHNQYIKDLNSRCPTMIPLESYIGHAIPILHKCLLCNRKYKYRPDTKLAGNGCRFCGRINNGGSISIDKEGTVYLVYIFKFDLYKIGITTKTVKERMQDNKLNLSEYEIVLERYFNNGTDIMKLEKVWKENLKEYLVNTGELHSGNTETFRFKE